MEERRRYKDMERRNRYREFERIMTIGLLADAALFILCIISGALQILWLKIVFAVLTLAVGALGLAVLFLKQELLRSRSLWLSCGFFALIMCTLCSLILMYP